ncbi:sigma-70 family RNA polymerase sigma factor [Chitinophaga sp. SYP-B3965]|uniref:RNA polymerase sigma factor n=1 Tax=Chitinophaga sp. SYP-B3965 TaxID=2663120 RepID=UPI001299A6CD|nr:sigma-70 family RNA polymerase sigma factor [Chitinophaga sp. SYP-B3965]MRG48460.1 sigma-70 family RNA polymerase sigma factor [Chitinophaga sp. SYP-B3965]
MDLNLVTENQLKESFKDFKAGNDQAFTVLYAGLHKALLANAYFILKDVQLAEDAVQEVFAAVWSKRDKLTIETNIKGYFFIAIKNECLNMKRKSKRTILRENMTSLIEAVCNYRVMDVLENKELRKMLIDAYKAVKLKKIAFDKFYLEGLSQKEIAAELGQEEVTVRKQISRVVKKMRDNLNGNL